MLSGLQPEELIRLRIPGRCPGLIALSLSGSWDGLNLMTILISDDRLKYYNPDSGHKCNNLNIMSLKTTNNLPLVANEG